MLFLFLHAFTYSTLYKLQFSRMFLSQFYLNGESIIKKKSNYYIFATGCSRPFTFDCMVVARLSSQSLNYQRIK